MADFNENVSVNGTLTLFRLEGSALEVTSFTGVPNAGIHVTTVGGSGTPHILVGAVGVGIQGESSQGNGLLGIARSESAAAVAGENISTGAVGHLASEDPVFHEHAGVYGESDKQGVTGVTNTDNLGAFSTGVFGFSKNGGGIGVRGETVTGIGVQGRSFGAGVAGRFDGNVEIAGDLLILNGKDIRLADFSEDFDRSVGEEIESGSVVVLDDRGAVRESQIAYDRRVAGVVSGAGNFRPAITLDRQASGEKRITVALMGKVYCKVDANAAPVEIGDLLTPSATPGHAMKAMDQRRAFGAVIGKAMQPLSKGRGLIPILIALQ